MVSLKKKSFDLHADGGADTEDFSSDSDSEESPKFYHRRKLTAARMKSKRCIKEGYLCMKQRTGSFQKWKKYYFRLQEKKTLCYAKEPNEEIFAEVDIQDSSVAETSIKNVNNSFSIITSFLTLILCGDSRREMEEWISAVKNVTLRNSQSDILDRLSDGHKWYSRSHSRPTICNYCGDLLPGVTSKGLACEVCTYTVHKQCAVRAVDKCKWTNLESMGKQEQLDEYSDPFAMAHQWMQLNISPGSKCFVCDKNCGGRKNPQDRKCLWCGLTVHNTCENPNTVRSKCYLGENASSILPPTALVFSKKQGILMEATRPPHGNPLLVFVNTRSGDNQGVKFLRKFKQLLNPAQIFDLSFGGPAQGLKVYQNLDLFRILVCGGDGSVGWVMTEIDRMNLMKKCQISVLPLGTGNDLSRVLRWGASFYDATALPYLLKWLEGAKTEMLDRWSIMIREEKSLSESPTGSLSSLSSATSEYDTGSESSISSLEYNIGRHLTTIMHSNQDAEVISSAGVLCGIVKDLVSKVGSASADPSYCETGETNPIADKCSVLNDKLDKLLHTLHVEAEAVKNPSEMGRLTEPGKPKVFVPRDALMSRANSLKKALRQILDHTEKAVDEQNAQTIIGGSGLTETIVATTSADNTEVSPPTITMHSERPSSGTSLPDIFEGSTDTLSQTSPTTGRYSPRLLSRSSMHKNEPTVDEFKSAESKATVHFAGTTIAKAFLKESDNPGPGMLYKALIANVDTLCAPAAPVAPDNTESTEGFTERCVMNNYFGVGIDAKIALDFHLKREENPGQFRSRKLNLIHYGVLGGKEFLQSSYKNLDQLVHVEVDGHKLSLPRLQGVVVLNIPSYMSGSNFWGSWKDDDGFTTPSFDDKMIEVVAIFSCSQMGMAKVFGGMPYHRMAQCRSVKITITDEAVPVQVDGEPWMQPPSVIKIVHKNRAQMLVRDAEFESTLKSWTDIQQVKHEKNYLSEEENMKQMVFSLNALIKCIHLGVCHTIIHQRLLPMAENLERKLSNIFPSGKLAECASRFDLSELVSMGDFFERNVTEFMEKQVKDLSPAMSLELKNRINEAAVKTREAIRNVVEIHGLGTLNEESEKRKGFGFGKLRLTKRPDISKSNTAPAGRMIQFWRVTEVCDWLNAIGLGEYRETFIIHNIGGSRLLHLDKELLKNLGVNKQEHRKRILRSIKRFCGGLSPTSASSIDRTEQNTRLKVKEALHIEKDFDSQ